ncbi:MAG: 4Fe-4S binding protein [Acidiferrobacterales bacterium]
MSSKEYKPSYPGRHLNKLRWLTLSTVFLMLVLLPFLYLYQTYVAAHAYDLLLANEKLIYNVMAAITDPFVFDPEHDLDAIKGTTWSGRFFGLQISDPLAVVGQISASLSFNWTFFLTALIPIAATVLLGRFFCGWICPASFIYELNETLSNWLRKVGVPLGDKRFDRRFKYLVLAAGAALSAISGSVLYAGIYPPAIVGREIYYAIAQAGFGVGAVFFLFTLLFDLMVSRRGFCRYLCPGGALYSMLGRYRVVRIQRVATQCNDCQKCDAVCEFGLAPMKDDFGQECNNCSACIAVCPTDALKFKLALHDISYAGPGHLGHNYRRQQQEESHETETA